MPRTELRYDVFRNINASSVGMLVKGGYPTLADATRAITDLQAQARMAGKTAPVYWVRKTETTDYGLSDLGL